MGFDSSVFLKLSINSALMAMFSLLTFSASYLIAKQVPTKKMPNFLTILCHDLSVSGNSLDKMEKNTSLKHTNG